MQQTGRGISYALPRNLFSTFIHASSTSLSEKVSIWRADGPTTHPSSIVGPESSV